jgi:hypothetical protein
MKNVIFIFIFLISSNFIYSKSVKDAYKALTIYNYFEAKQIFKKKIKKHISPSSYGLALIYYRKDNPFHNLDSAYKYANLAFDYFPTTSTKIKQTLAEYQYSELSIFDLKRKISTAFFEFTIKENTILSYQNFIAKHPWAIEYNKAIYKKDSIAFQEVLKVNTISEFNSYLKKYPDSEFKQKVEFLIHQKVYLESTSNKTLDEYLNFIQKNPTNYFVKDAEDEIFLIQTKDNTISNYSDFIKNFPINHNVKQAWKKLFQIYMYNYSENRISSFLNEYPNYPYKEDIEIELAKSKILVFPFKKGNYFGLMNKDGEAITKANYDWIYPFKEGLAMASKNGKVGFIDKDNVTVIPFEYDEALDFEEGRAIVTKNKKSGIIDRTGKLLFKIEYKEIGSFSENLVFAKKDSLFAYYDVFGNQVINERFDEAFSFKDELAPVIIDEHENYINRFGTLIFPEEYERINRISENLFIFQKGENFGLITKDLILIQDAKFSQISTLSENKIAFVLNDKIGYFNQFGMIEIAPIYDNIKNFSKVVHFKMGYARVKYKNKYGIIDHSGKWVIPATYQNLGDVSEQIAFLKDNLWGFINLQNKVIIQNIYEEAISFDGNFSIVGFSDKIGVIDLNGEVVVPIEFDAIQKLNDVIFSCQTKGLKKIFNTENQHLYKNSYANIMQNDKDLLILVNDKDLHYYLISEKKLIRPKNSD